MGSVNGEEDSDYKAGLYNMIDPGRGLRKIDIHIRRTIEFTEGRRTDGGSGSHQPKE